MKNVLVRVYEELNDPLPDKRKKLPFDWLCDSEATVGEILHAAGVRLEEVDLILLDGEPAGLDEVPEDSSRISAYPVFESINIGSVTKTRDRPLRNTRFVADAGLEELAGLLRRSGFDCRTASGPEAADACAEGEPRILLTRGDRPTYVSRVCVIADLPAEKQLEELSNRLDLRIGDGPTQDIPELEEQDPLVS